MEKEYPQVVRKLSEAVRFKTVSHQDSKNIDYGEFDRFQYFLQSAFPNVHDRLKKEIINGYGLLFHWESGKSSKPVLLMAHQDVVPIEEDTEKDWKYPPFSGAIEDGFVWGRGTLDIKAVLICVMQAVEKLLSEGYEPSRDIYMAFGHDEEITGENGAGMISSYLKNKGLEFEYILDEGGNIMQGVLPLLNKPVATVGVAEKGFLSLCLSVKTAGGHSSMPGEDSCIRILSTAVGKLRHTLFKPYLKGPTSMFFSKVAPDIKGFLGFVFKNQFVFSPLLKKVLSNSPTTNALIRTTIAPTIFHAGDKENVLPQNASVVINLRIIPQESVEFCIEKVKKAINDSRVEVKILDGSRADNPSAVTSLDSFGYRTLEKVMEKVFPGVITAPFIMVGSTDSKFYSSMSKCVLRFAPIFMEGEDLARVHGTNERIRIDNLVKMEDFYYELLKES
jgi:carboxypeptidase PM20D1